MAMVIGPTPPGTGVIKLAFLLTPSKSTSPTILYPLGFDRSSTRVIPTSIITASSFTISAFNSYEQVAFDIEGQYALNQLETDLGSTDFGKVAFNLGTGAFLNHTRSQLNSSIINLENFNEYKMSNGSFLFGLKYQIEMVNASYKEWQYLDSAGYSLPKSTNEIVLPVLIQAKNTLQTNRYSAFLQRNWTLLENKKTGRTILPI